MSLRECSNAQSLTWPWFRHFQVHCMQEGVLLLQGLPEEALETAQI